MDQTCNVPHSTDWLGTPLSGLARVESSLRCQVCKDFFDNPVITSCSHTFCSLCIRRCLSAEAKCPTCRSPDTELKLRRNWAVQELVDAFKETRSTVLDFARRGNLNEEESEGPAVKKRRIEASEPEPQTTVRRTRSQSKKVDSESSSVQAVHVVDSEASGDDSTFQPPSVMSQPDDGLVPCPVCGQRMKNESVYFHLDKCTGLKTQPTPATGFLTKSPARATPQVFQPPKRLPTINYALLKDNDLRRKLRELGIPDWGGKPLLQKRHTEWLSLWNANCDAFAPKSKRELLRELDVWERTQGGQASAGPNVVMRKDFDGSAWSAAYGDDFKKLIADARKKSVKAPTRPAPTEEVPAEADTTEMTGTRAIEQAGLQADPVSVEQVCVGAETTDTRMMDQAELQPEGRSEAQEHPPLPLEELPPNDPDSGYQPVKSSGDGDQNRKHSQDSMILETESPVIIVEDAMA